VVGRFIGAARQTTQNKKLIYPPVLWHFRDFREDKIACCIERFNKLCHLSWHCSSVQGRVSALADVSAFRYRTSVVRICFNFDNWNCEPKCDNVNLRAVHMNINKNNNIGVLCWVVVLAMSRKCVNSPNLFSYVYGEFPLPLLWKRCTNFIFAVRLGIRTRAGHHIHVAVAVCNIYVAGSLVRTNQCLSQSLWCRENRKIILQIAAFVSRKEIAIIQNLNIQLFFPILLMISHQFLRHLNNGLCMKKKQPADLQKMNLDLSSFNFPELTVPHLISYSELNDLVRDPYLSKIQAELFASRLQGWNLIWQGVKCHTESSSIVMVFLMTSS
jgi:hypothetical protein